MRVSLVLLALVICASANAQGNADLMRCRGIKDAQSRLTCYDALGQPPAAVATAADYKRVALSDLKLDRQSMRGQRIEAAGTMQVMGEIVLLKDGMMDMTPIYVDTTNLSRVGRKFVLDCNTGCSATVRGKVGVTKMMEVGIQADSISSD